VRHPRPTEKARQTLLSQLPAARKSAWGDQAKQEIKSDGGSATSTSLSVALVAVERVKKEVEEDGVVGCAGRHGAVQQYQSGGR
jgi:hypothetical protein